MEKIYLGQDEIHPRLWHSNKIELSEYFELYSKEVNTCCVKNGKFNFTSPVLKCVLPDSIYLNREIYNTLQKLTCIDQLKPKVKCPQMLKMKQLMKERTFPFGGREQSIMGFGLKEENNSSANSVIQNELEDLTSTSASKRVHVPGVNKFIEDCSFDNISNVHEHDRNPARRNYQNGINKLKHRLLVLRDKIICASDFQDVQGDLSDRPDTPVTFMSRDVYRSAMFYIDNTFYIDGRYTDYVDYSDVIRKWALGRGISVGSTLDMRELAVGKLTLRFGYPYLYLHQGCCEHLIIVNDARWIVTGNDQLLHDFSHMCDTCFQLFNYKDGKKHGDFKAYRFVDPGSLL